MGLTLGWTLVNTQRMRFKPSNFIRRGLPVMCKGVFSALNPYALLSQARMGLTVGGICSH